MIEKYFTEFSKYIKNLNLDFKIEHSILSTEFLNSNPTFYLFYPKLFSIETKENKETIDLLCIAAIIDEKNISKYPVAVVCQEESVKLLTFIFGLNSNFWSLWNLRKNEFFNAITIQNDLIEKSNVEFIEFETLADYKSSFGKIAIDSIFSLQNKNDTNLYNKYLKSHKYFSIGFQL